MIYVLTNRKGGSGKSSIAVNLAGSYAQVERVLLLDLDEQGDASAWLGVEDTGERLADALCGRTGLGKAIMETAYGVDVAPAGEALGYVAESLGPEAVGAALKSIRDRNYGAVVIDCPPALSRLVISGWRVATTAIVPVDSPKALRGLARLRYAWEDCRLDFGAIRVVLTRHDSRRLLDRELERQARELYGNAVLATRIGESVLVRESAAWKRPLIVHAPTHPVSSDFRRLAREVTRV